MRCAGEHDYSACGMPRGSDADVCANSSPVCQRKGRSVDVAQISGADVCDNSGPFNRERVALRHDGACVCAILACLWWCRLLTEGRWLQNVACRAPVRGVFSDSVSSPIGVGCTVLPAERQ